jgi:outer membrane protein assembly factor BamE (lipoprotein component of BamABCDE complex)
VNTVDISALKLDAVASAVATYNRSLMNGNGAIVSNINFAPTGLSQTPVTKVHGSPIMNHQYHHANHEIN